MCLGLYSTQEGLIRLMYAPGIGSGLDPHFLTKSNGVWKYNTYVLEKIAKASEKDKENYIQLAQSFLEQNQDKNTEELITAFEEAMK